MASEVANAYAARLRELTFNSKPIINNLTILADQNRAQGVDIVKVIVQRLERDAPNDRLPLFYLMDSILKNVKGDYVRLFSPYIPHIFVVTFEQANADIRRRLLHLLKTWEDTRLFPAPTLKPIHDRVGHGQADPTRQQQPPPQQPGHPAVDPYAGRKRPPEGAPPTYPPQQKRSREDPYYGRSAGPDPRAHGAPYPDGRYGPPQGGAYPGPWPGPYPPYGPGAPPSGGIPPHAALPYGSAPGGGDARLQETWMALQKQMVNRPDLQPLMNDLRASLDRGQSIRHAVDTLTHALSVPPAAGPYAGSVYTPPQPVPYQLNPVELLQTLNTLNDTFGTTKTEGTKAGEGATGPATLAGAYSRSLDTSAAPSGVAVIKTRPDDPVFLLYDGIPLQCKTCGLRCKDQDQMGIHLDWHFSMNKRDARRAKVAVSQDWFMPVNDWVEYEEVKAAAKLQQQQQQPAFDQPEEVEVKVVHNFPVPADDDAPNTCFMCHEPFEKFWDAESDCWMYRGVIEVDGHMVHQTCHELSLGQVTQPAPKKTATPVTPDLKSKTPLAEFPQEVPELEADDQGEGYEYYEGDGEGEEEYAEGDG